MEILIRMMKITVNYPVYLYLLPAILTAKLINLMRIGVYKATKLGYRPSRCCWYYNNNKFTGIEWFWE